MITIVCVKVWHLARLFNCLVNINRIKKRSPALESARNLDLCRIFLDLFGLKSDLKSNQQLGIFPQVLAGILRFEPHSPVFWETFWRYHPFYISGANRGHQYNKNGSMWDLKAPLWPKLLPVEVGNISGIYNATTLDGQRWGQIFTVFSNFWFYM
jgi:hypothetical protein